MNNATFKTAFAASMIATTTLAFCNPDYDETFCNTMKDAMTVFGCGKNCCRTIESEIVLSPSNLTY